MEAWRLFCQSYVFLIKLAHVQTDNFCIFAINDAFMGLVFFKINKHRQFNYKPVYYDAQKEELAELKRKSNVSKEMPEDVSLEEMRAKMKTRWNKERTAKTGQYTTVKIAFLLFLLFVVVYYLFR